MTVIVYIPSWPPMAEMSSISTILPAIRNKIPIGAYLKTDGCYEFSNETFCSSSELKIRPGTYHIIMATSLMMASLRQSKKSFRGCPCSLMFPMMRPKHIENTTRPSALIPFTDPGTGIISSRVISWLPLGANNVSFTVIVTWTILLAYCVLNWNMQNKEESPQIVAGSSL